jgi:biotin operon repressor
MCTEYCPHCHQPLADTVYGVRLPSMKVRIFRYIESHPGQSAEEIGSYLGKGKVNIWSHIYQINDYFMDTGIKITGGRFVGYHVKKGKKL